MRKTLIIFMLCMLGSAVSARETEEVVDVHAGWSALQLYFGEHGGSLSRLDSVLLKSASCDLVMAEPLPRKPFYMSVRTNMLHDLLLIPSVGVEFYLGRGWSVASNWDYCWWSSNSRHFYYRYYGGYLAGRRWLGRQAREKPLTGHHVGVYAQTLIYDFEFGGKGYMGGKPGGNIFEEANYAFGIEYGYSLPIGPRLNIDFTIGLGYMGGKYYVYEPEDSHYVWLETKYRHFWGPTKAEVSLVWLLGNGNENSRKGGGRR